MNAAYLGNQKTDENAIFEMFIRTLPQDWGYFIAAGVNNAIDYVCQLRARKKGIIFFTHAIHRARTHFIIV